MCARSAVVKNRKKDPVTNATYRFYNLLRRRGIKDISLTARATVERIMDRYDHQSAISVDEKADPMELCIVPYFSDIPPQEWHCVVITTSESRHIKRMKPRDEKAHKLFPEEIQAEMKAQRIKHGFL